MVVHEDNKRLKAELEEVKQQLAQTTIANVSATIAPQQAISTPATALSDKSQSLLASILTRTAFNTNAKSNSTLTLSRSESPILTPNLNKDVPNSSSVNGKSWKDKNPVYIHKALVPEICIGDQFQFDPKGAWSKEDEMWDCSWLNLERTPKELSKADINPFLASTVVYELMQTYAAVTLDMMPLLKGEYSPRTLAHGESGASVQDYESDRRMDEAVEWQKQQELCTRVQGLTSTARKTDIDTDELPEEGFRMLFNSSDIAPTPSTPFSCPSASESFLDEDPNMLEWLYESMVACLVGLNVQNTGDQQIYLPFSEVHYA
ncbi:hypothetical protein BC939DRAFT_171908 [Gamsiella multidivaricata]|uniref:uncharacterized protein n=1 Tax=Gamsiella multidivaricata TaxID=101098 RepID=UPI00221F3A85|nr:uncharacterized protein BC939DRAFT_171908 [Gamsiella multidivaricata]KAI7822840.1 hypothetical protein BC939DRAFT_171908 [Gamsiella multidivaricata]